MNRANGNLVGETRALLDASISLHGPAKIVRPVSRAWMGIGVLAQALRGRLSKRIAWSDVSKVNAA
jgi:hypothetical protein